MDGLVRLQSVRPFFGTLVGDVVGEDVPKGLVESMSQFEGIAKVHHIFMQVGP